MMTLTARIANKKSQLLGTSKRQRGGVMVEAAICLPLLILMFIGMVDILFLSSTYMSLSQISREAVITGSSLSDIAFLRTNTVVPTQSQLAQCYSDPDYQNYKTIAQLGPLVGECANRVIRWRIMRLAETNKLRILPGSLGITTRAAPDGTHTVAEVTVAGDYDAIFKPFKGIRLTARASAE